MGHYDSSNRILVLSSSVRTGIHFIQRIKAISKANAEGGAFEPTDNNDIPAAVCRPTIVPWLLSNRYYSANVHFAVATIQDITTSQAVDRNVPAVILVWANGESYEQYATDISRWLEGTSSEPEVALAVRLSSSPDSAISGTKTDDSNREENNTTIDRTLMSLGFEYIDATGVLQSNPLTGDEYVEGDAEAMDGVPSLPRVLDALSTVMWPSMTRKKAQNVQDDTKKYRGEYSNLDEIIANDPAGLLPELDACAPWQSQSEQPRDADQRTLASGGLAQSWAENGLPSADPWGVTATFSHLLISSTETEPASPFGIRGGTTERDVIIGFDDDFTGFVSAPVLSSSQPSAEDKLDRPSLGVAMSVHASATSSPSKVYLPLLSESELMASGETTHHQPFDKATNDDDDDLELALPTREEIKEMTMRLFGTGRNQAHRTSAPEPTLVGGGSPDSKHILKPTVPIPKLEAVQSEMKGNSDADDLLPDGMEDRDEEDDPYDLASFDLTQVLNALQQFKSEIAAMENEDDRRKAAAKVALGLVYGLEAGQEC